VTTLGDRSPIEVLLDADKATRGIPGLLSTGVPFGVAASRRYRIGLLGLLGRGIRTLRIPPPIDILRVVAKTSVDVDRDIAAQAAAILGTDTLRDTIDASLREIVDAKRRLELIALLSEPERYDFSAADAAWGADE
jgi:Arc/MetJ family transcription regulator